MTQTTPNFADLAARARKMSVPALIYSRRDAAEAARAADALELAGCRVLKTGGYYRDEASVYARELDRRQS